MQLSLDCALDLCLDPPSNVLVVPPPVLQVIIQKLSEVEDYKAAVLQYADDIMTTLLGVFNSRNNSVHEEAMLAVGAFTYACGRQFSKYLAAFYPFLKMGLMNHAEWQVRAPLSSPHVQQQQQHRS